MLITLFLWRFVLHGLICKYLLLRVLWSCTCSFFCIANLYFIVELLLLQKLELHLEVCSRNYRTYPFDANIWFNRWIKKPTLATVLDTVRCAVCFGVSVHRHQPQVKIGLPSFKSEMLQPLRKLVTHFAAHFPVWKSMNNRTSCLTFRKHKTENKVWPQN